MVVSFVEERHIVGLWEVVQVLLDVLDQFKPYSLRFCSDLLQAIFDSFQYDLSAFQDYRHFLNRLYQSNFLESVASALELEHRIINLLELAQDLQLASWCLNYQKSMSG